MECLRKPEIRDLKRKSKGNLVKSYESVRLQMLKEKKSARKSSERARLKARLRAIG